MIYFPCCVADSQIYGEFLKNYSRSCQSQSNSSLIRKQIIVEVTAQALGTGMSRVPQKRIFKDLCCCYTKRGMGGCGLPKEELADAANPPFCVTETIDTVKII